MTFQGMRLENSAGRFAILRRHKSVRVNTGGVRLYGDLALFSIAGFCGTQ